MIWCLLRWRRSWNWSSPCYASTQAQGITPKTSVLVLLLPILSPLPFPFGGEMAKSDADVISFCSRLVRANIQFPPPLSSLDYGRLQLRTRLMAH